jgi:hypothetical protein
LGLVEIPPGADPVAAAARGLIERQLLLTEVARFSPPEPDAAAVQREVASLERRAGSELAALLTATGLSEGRIREHARDTLRIEAYLNQRFGVATQVGDDEALRYYESHLEEFRENGRLMSFDEGLPRAKALASAERRRATVAQWMRDLRARASISCQLDEDACRTVLN